MKLRLFQVAPRNTSPAPAPSEYFSDKQEAKRVRDQLGKEQYKVTLGPDHARYKAR